MATYWEKLRDPRWQQKRLRIMDRAEFMCENCGAKDKTLNVHHKLYRKGADPWAYADHELACLCENCHEIQHDWKRRLDEALALGGGIEMESVVGYAQGIYWRQMGPDEDGYIEVISAEQASGIADAFGGISWEEIIKNTDEKLQIKVTKLYDMLDAKKGR